jgi:hypothetical protein
MSEWATSYNQYSMIVVYARNCRPVGGSAFHIILAKVQNPFCIIVFCDKVFYKQRLPELGVVAITYNS